MLNKLEQKIINFIKDNALFNTSEKVLLAISGGADSTALVHILLKLKAHKLLNNNFLCVHINHQLRGPDADADEKFVSDLAKKYNLPVIIKKIDIKKIARENKLSIETAARNERLKAILETAKANNCSTIATAHHCNDNAETILQRLARGTGFKGLSGIWPKRLFPENIIITRPMLSASRSEIIDCLAEKNLPFCHDCTNDHCQYRRNFIRHKLLPQLQQQSENDLSQMLFNLSASARQLCLKIEKTAQKLWPQIAVVTDNQVEINIESFTNKLPELQIEFVRIAFSIIGEGQQNITAQHYQRIIELTRKNITGKTIKLPSNFEASRQYNKLIFKKTPTHDITGNYFKQTAINTPGQTTFNQLLIETKILPAKDCNLQKFKAEKDNHTEWFDYDKLKLPLTIRPRQTGDYFTPIGQKNEKKVGKFLTDAKIPAPQRSKTLIIKDTAGIIWIYPIRTSQQALITEETKTILQININPNSLK